MAVEPILELRNIHARYGAITALRGVSLKLYPGEIVAMIGANGAGKSTTLMTTCGIVPVDEGDILYCGRSIKGVPAEKLPVMGLCQVPEGRRIFPRLTVHENLELGAFHRRERKRIAWDMQWVYSLFPVLGDRRRQMGGTLSGGEQQMLAIARALMTKPRVLLMDEPSLGLAPLMVQRIFRIIHEINEIQGTSILLVEQNANLALQAARRGYVLETGVVTMADDAQSLLNNAEIRNAYLGE